MAAWESAPLVESAPAWASAPVVGEAPSLTMSDRIRAQFTSELGIGSNNPFSAGMVGRALAGILGLPMQTVENINNLSRAGAGAIAGAMGRPDLMPGLVELPGNVSAARRGLSAMGLITENPDPTNPAYKAAEIAGGMAPFALLPGSAGPTALSTAGAVVGERLGGPQGEMIGALAPTAATLAAKSYMSSGRPNPQAAATEQTARAEGYKFPPAESSPNMVNRFLEGWAGKLTTRQMASSQNAEVTTRLVKRSLGIPENQQITEGALTRIRTEAGQVYEQVKNFGASNNLQMRPDGRFRNDIQGLGGDFNAAIREFPDIVRVPQIEQLQQALNVQRMSPVAAVELVKNLRFQASENAKALGNPQSRALMSAQRDAANAVEGLIERMLSRSGNRDLYTQFRDARTAIARSYDIEAALNPATGTVSPRVLSNLEDRGKALGGGLQTVARTFKLSPHSMQSPEQIGSQPGISPLDFGAGAVAGASSPEMAGVMFARPLVRSAIMSDPFQALISQQAFNPGSALGALLRANTTANQEPKK